MTSRLKVRRKPRSFLELYQADALLRACRHLEQEHRGLTWERVRLIRSSDLSNVALARELGVSDVLSSKVRRNIIWVDRPERANRNDVPRVAPIGTLLLFGLRIEELCGLNGGDLDFARGVLCVRDSDAHATKTEAGHRVIPMLPAARERARGSRAEPSVRRRRASVPHPHGSQADARQSPRPRPSPGGAARQRDPR